MLRAWDAGVRPMHTDEAVHATKLGYLIEQGEYKYDLTEYHGPTLYYLSLPFIWFSGAQSHAELKETTLRALPIFFGVLLIGSTWFLRGLIGNGGMLFAVVLTAVSPIFVYYSRYYIHEMMLIVWMMGVFICGWKYFCKPRLGWMVGLGVFTGLMFASKETWVLMGGALGLACIWVLLMEWKSGQFKELAVIWRTGFQLWHWGVGVVVGLVVAFVFYSSFGKHPQGIVDSFLTYFSYVNRAEGQGHEKPWWYYVTLLGWYKNGPGFVFHEWIVLAPAFIGAIIVFLVKIEDAKKRILLRTLALYGWVLMAIYSVIPYKMPWLALGFMHGFILISGWSAQFLWISKIKWWWKAGITLLFLALVWQAVDFTRLTNHRLSSDVRNPYVYSHTSRDFLRLQKRLDAIAQYHEDGKEVLIKAICEEYWPVPWYLRAYPNIGYWHSIPENPDAPVVITSPHMNDALDIVLQDEYMSEVYGLRHGVFLVMKIRKDLWNKFIKDQ